MSKHRKAEWRAKSGLADQYLRYLLNVVFKGGLLCFSIFVVMCLVLFC